MYRLCTYVQIMYVHMYVCTYIHGAGSCDDARLHYNMYLYVHTYMQESGTNIVCNSHTKIAAGLSDMQMARLASCGVIFRHFQMISNVSVLGVVHRMKCCCVMPDSIRPFFGGESEPASCSWHEGGAKYCGSGKTPIFKSRLGVLHAKAECCIDEGGWTSTSTTQAQTYSLVPGSGG